MGLFRQLREDCQSSVCEKLEDGRSLGILNSIISDLSELEQKVTESETMFKNQIRSLKDILAKTKGKEREYAAVSQWEGLFSGVYNQLKNVCRKGSIDIQRGAK